MLSSVTPDSQDISYIPSKSEWITLKVTASTLKTIDKKGISEVMKIAKEKGLL